MTLVMLPRSKVKGDVQLILQNQHNHVLTTTVSMPHAIKKMENKKIDEC